jgi:hypothetical protein
MLYTLRIADLGSSFAWKVMAETIPTMIKDNEGLRGQISDARVAIVGKHPYEVSPRSSNPLWSTPATT